MRNILLHTCLILPMMAIRPIYAQEHRCAIHRTADTGFEAWLQGVRSAARPRADEILTLPVVVHVVHLGEELGEGHNLSIERIHSQLQTLNEDFRRLPGTRGFNDDLRGADARIEFVLAQRDPSGRPTTGIVRVNALDNPAPFGGSMVAVGAWHSLWDPYRYLNIWSIAGIQDTGLGEARFPQSDLPGLDPNSPFPIPGHEEFHGIPVSDIDGVAINSVHFGVTDLDSPYRFGRTATHEVGHFLGLYHVWGDEGFEGSCAIDDYCEDTPNVSSRTSGCPVGKRACEGEEAMIANYMDYSDDACMNIFTNDQVRRMRAVLTNSPRRKELLASRCVRAVLEVERPTELAEVYPNPAQGAITVTFDEPTLGAGTVEIFSLSGRLLFSKQIGSHTTQCRVRRPESARNLCLLKVSIGPEVIWKKVLFN